MSAIMKAVVGVGKGAGLRGMEVGMWKREGTVGIGGRR